MSADVPAARSTLRLLQALSGRAAPVPASTLSRETGIPRSSLYQLLRVMLEEGFLVHYPEERAYGLSSLVSEVGAGALRTDRLRRLAHPLLERLAATSSTPVVAHLAVLSGPEVTYVDRVTAPRSPTTVVSVGVRLPAHLTATGRSALAALDRAQLRALYSDHHALYRRTGMPSPASMGELHALLDAVRRRGWAVENEEVTSGLTSVAAVALDRFKHPVASIGLTFRTHAQQESDLSAHHGSAVAQAAALLALRLNGH